jgi:hypothetical protein
MKKILSILALSVLAIGAKAQVLEQVKYKHQADVIVCFVYYKYQADAVVYEGKRYEARQQQGIWYYDDKDPYRLKIYVTEYQHEADINIFVALKKWEVEVDGFYNDLFKR